LEEKKSDNSSMNVKNFEDTMFLIKYFYKDHMVTLTRQSTDYDEAKKFIYLI